jgi:hypothetical protein
MTNEEAERRFRRECELTEGRASEISGASKAERFTYRQLRDYLNMLSETQLDQSVQALLLTGRLDRPELLHPAYMIDTVTRLCHDETDDAVLIETRDTETFAHRPEQVVLLIDHPPHDEEGNTLFTLEDDGTIRGNKTGKLYSFGRPH